MSPPCYPHAAPGGPGAVRSGPFPGYEGRRTPLRYCASQSRRAAHLLLVALALAVVEGALRKWFIGIQANHWALVAYFSKDIVFATILLYHPKAAISPALGCFRNWLVAGILMLLLGMLLSSLRGINPVGAALTFRATVLLPTVACLAVTRLGKIRISKVAWLLALLTLLNSGLALLQNRLPVEHLLNRHVGSDTEIAVLESGIRATGTFSFITGLEVLTFVGIWAGMVLLSVAPRAWTQAAGLVTICAAFACGLASVSRAPLLAGVGALMAWAWYSRMWFRHSRAVFLSILLLLLAIAAGLAPVFMRLSRAVLERHQSGGDTFANRAFGQFDEAMQAVVLAPFGCGFGSEQIAGNYAAKGQMTFTTFENQLPRLILETGVPGLLGFLTICAGSIVSLQRAKKELVKPQTRSVALATQLLLVCLFYTNVIFNHTASAFAWLLFAAALAAIPGSEHCSLYDSKRLLQRRSRFHRPYPAH